MKKVLRNSELVAIVNNIFSMKEREKQSGSGAKLSLRVNYALNKNFKKISKEIEPYEEARKEIIEKYNNPRAKEGAIDILPANKKKYNEEIKELLAIENDVEVHMISYEDLENCNGLLISDLEALEFMVTETEAEKTE